MKIMSLIEKLREKTVQDLNAIAKKYGLSGYSKLSKADLIKLVRRKLKALASGKAKKKTAKQSSKKAKPKKATKRAKKKTKRTTKSKARTKKKKKEAESRSTGEGGMILLPRDPEWLYVYWDLTVQQETLLRTNGVPTLRLLGYPDRRELKRIPLSQGARSWHIQAGAVDRDYIAELGVVDWRGVFRPLLTSNPASTPPAEVSGNYQVSFGKFDPGEPVKPQPAPKGVEPAQAERFHKLSSDQESETDSASSHDIPRRK